MAAKSKTDTFSNVAALFVQESAANTQTSVKFAFPFSIMDKMALVIQRIEYTMGNMVTAFNSSGDLGFMALTVAASVTTISKQNDPLIVDDVMYQRIDYGAAASGALHMFPFIKDLTSIAGGGLLVAPSPLYGMIQGFNCGAALDGWIKLYYTYLELGTDEYWQLVESRRIISN